MRHHRFRRTLPTLALGAALGMAGQARAADPTSWIDDLHVRAGAPLFILPAAAGAVIAVDERRATDRYTQTVTLRGDPGTVGENQIVATVTRDALAPRIEDEALSAEAAERLPPMTMVLGPAGLRDEMGGFGSAVGRSGALACAYGWQSVDLADPWISGDRPSIFQERHALSLRVRLCRTDLRPADLIAAMQGLRSTLAGGTPEGVPLRAVAPGDPLSAALDLTEVEPAAAGDAWLAPASSRALVAGAFVPPARGAAGPLRPRPRPVRVARVAPARPRAPVPRAADPAPSKPAALAGMPQVPLPQ